MTRVLRAIEQWASQSEDRVRLLIVLVGLACGVFVLITISIVAWIMLPPGYL